METAYLTNTRDAVLAYITSTTSSVTLTQNIQKSEVSVNINLIFYMDGRGWIMGEKTK